MSQTTAPSSNKIRNAVIRLAGNSQDGIQSIGAFLGQLAGSTAQDVMTYMTIPSTISGGPSIFQVHLGSGEVLHPGDEADTLVAFYQHSYDGHLHTLKDGGICFYDSDNVEELKEQRGIIHIGVPFTSATIEAIGGNAKSRGKNIFVLGLLCAVYQLDRERISEIMSAKFGKKSEDILRNVMLAFDDGNSRKGGAFELVDEETQEMDSIEAAIRLTADLSPRNFGVYYEAKRPTRNELEREWLADAQSKIGNATQKDLLRRRFASMR